MDSKRSRQKKHGSKQPQQMKSKVVTPPKDALPDDDEDEDTITCRPVYLPNACHVCKALQDSAVKLKTCGACQLICYCSPEHQKQHWSQHKSLCRWVRDFTAKQGKSHVLSGGPNVGWEQWRKMRFDAVQSCGEALGRPLEPYEREMFLFPKCCYVCRETYPPQGVVTCINCNAVNFCKEHRDAPHKCDQLKVWVDIAIYQHKYGLPDPHLPTKCEKKYEPLPGSMKELLVMRLMGGPSIMSMGSVLFSCLTELASYPLTVLHALQQCRDLSTTSRLVIHLVGAELEFEGDAISKWDIFIFHLLPALTSLRLVFVGPQVAPFEIPPGVCPEDFRCYSCSKKGVDLAIEFQSGVLYHDYCESDAYTQPDVVCAFNCGLYRSTGFAGKDTWGQSLSALVREKGVPLLLTAYTDVEAPKDVHRMIKATGAKVIIPVTKNPYRSLRPLRNFVNEGDQPLMYRSRYYSVLCKE